MQDESVCPHWIEEDDNGEYYCQNEDCHCEIAECYDCGAYGPAHYLGRMPCLDDDIGVHGWLCLSCYQQFHADREPQTRRKVNLVGRSEGRTELKLTILHKHLGMMIGSSPYAAERLNYHSPTYYRGTQIFDLNGGDGAGCPGLKWERGSSIAISANLCVKRSNVNTRCYEINKKTFACLIDNLYQHLPELGFDLKESQRGRLVWQSTMGGGMVEVLNQDAREERFQLRRNEWLYVIHDPNSIGTRCFDTEAFYSVLRNGHIGSFFSALAFNASGLHRLPAEARINPWYDYIQGLIQTIGKRRLDIVIGKIINDPSLWAYLVLSPLVWTENKVIPGMKSAAKKCGKELNILSWALYQEQFQRMLDVLIMTEKEREMWLQRESMR